MGMNLDFIIFNIQYVPQGAIKLCFVGPYLVQKRIWYKFVPYSAEYGTTV